MSLVSARVDTGLGGIGDREQYATPELIPGMPKRVFDGYVARNIPETINTRGVPQKMQKFLLSKPQALYMASRASGIPVVAEHKEHFALGRVVANRLDDKSDWEAKLILDTDTNPDAQECAAFIDLGYTGSLSLTHDSRNNEPVELTICQVPARDGAIITAGRLPLDPSKTPIYSRNWERISASRKSYIRAAHPLTEANPYLVSANMANVETDNNIAAPGSTTTETATTTNSDLVSANAVSSTTPGTAPNGQPQQPIGMFGAPALPRMSPIPGGSSIGKAMLDYVDNDEARRRATMELEVKKRAAAAAAAAAGGVVPLSSPPAPVASPPAVATSPVSANANGIGGDNGSSLQLSSDPLEALMQTTDAMNKSGIPDHQLRMHNMNAVLGAVNELKSSKDEIAELKKQLAAAKAATTAQPPASPSKPVTPHAAMHLNSWAQYEAQGLTPPGTHGNIARDIQNGSVSAAMHQAAEHARHATANGLVAASKNSELNALFHDMSAKFSKLLSHKVPPQSQGSLEGLTNTGAPPAAASSTSAVPLSSLPSPSGGPAAPGKMQDEFQQWLEYKRYREATSSGGGGGGNSGGFASLSSPSAAPLAPAPAAAAPTTVTAPSPQAVTPQSLSSIYNPYVQEVQATKLAPISYEELGYGRRDSSSYETKASGASAAMWARTGAMAPHPTSTASAPVNPGPIGGERRQRNEGIVSPGSNIPIGRARFAGDFRAERDLVRASAYATSYKSATGSSRGLEGKAYASHVLDEWDSFSMGARAARESLNPLPTRASREAELGWPRQLGSAARAEFVTANGLGAIDHPDASDYPPKFDMPNNHPLLLELFSPKYGNHTGNSVNEHMPKRYIEATMKIAATNPNGKKRIGAAAAASAATA